MINERMRINGMICGDVGVPETRFTQPEGTEVEISLVLPDLPRDVKDEFEAWSHASDDAWALIGKWEKGVKP
jgi:hypothetical protein